MQFCDFYKITKCSDHCRLFAKAVFVSSQNYSDIAILEVEESAMSISPYVDCFLGSDDLNTLQTVEVGEEVFAVGHGLLTPNQSMLPFLYHLTLRPESNCDGWNRIENYQG